MRANPDWCSFGGPLTDDIPWRRSSASPPAFNCLGALKSLRGNSELGLPDLSVCTHPYVHGRVFLPPDCAHARGDFGRHRRSGKAVSWSNRIFLLLRGQRAGLT